MLDSHCHIDLYPNPTSIAIAAQRAGVFTVLVTNSPSAFEAAAPHVQAFKSIRLAVGLHPLNAKLHSRRELELFKELSTKTSFIGEVGLDFSPDISATRDQQIESFRWVLRCLDRKPKFVTVHSRRAEKAVLDLVAQEYGLPIVLHWYTGTTKLAEAALGAGHYFSFNPAMMKTEKGRALLKLVPLDRILTESDGPFAKVEGRPTVPMDVEMVEHELAQHFAKHINDLRTQLKTNFLQLFPKSHH